MKQLFSTCIWFFFAALYLHNLPETGNTNIIFFLFTYRIAELAEKPVVMGTFRWD